MNITIIVYLAHMELYQDFEKKPNYRTLPVKDVEELIKYISRWLDGKTQVEVNEQGNYVIKIEMPPLKQT